MPTTRKHLVTCSMRSQLPQWRWEQASGRHLSKLRHCAARRSQPTEPLSTRAVANPSTVVPLHESEASVCFGRARASVRALWENELDFATSAFERLIDLTTTPCALFTVGRVCG